MVLKQHAFPSRTARRCANAGRLLAGGAFSLLAGLMLHSLGSTPALAEERASRMTVVRAEKAITVSGAEVEDAVIVIQDGKIENVGKNLEYPLNARVIDARGKVVMPGLINMYTRFGMPNYSRKGVQAHRTVAEEWIPAAVDLQPLLELGFTTVALVPPGEDFPGRAMVVRTGGPDDARVLRDVSYLLVTAEKRELVDALKKARAEIDKVAQAREQFEKQVASRGGQAPASQPAPGQAAPASQPASAPASQPAFQPPPIDKSLQPLVDWLEKKSDPPVLTRLLRASDYVHFKSVLEDHELETRWLALSSFRTDMHLVADQMGTDKVEVVTRPWRSTMMDTSFRYYLPVALSRAGAAVALIPVSDTQRGHELLLEQTAELVRMGGWSRADAFKALTQTPAKMLGLEEQMGAIAKGQAADLVIFDADPFEPGARVTHVLIAGEVVHSETAHAAARDDKPEPH